MADLTAAEFEALAGRPPENDDLERVNCPKARTGAAHSEYPLHTQCGWCARCHKPKIVCAGSHRTDPDRQPAEFLRNWWYIGEGHVGPLGEPHSLWALRLRTVLGRKLRHVHR